MEHGCFPHHRFFDFRIAVRKDRFRGRTEEHFKGERRFQIRETLALLYSGDTRPAFDTGKTGQLFLRERPSSPQGTHVVDRRFAFHTVCPEEGYGCFPEALRPLSLLGRVRQRRGNVPQGHVSGLQDFGDLKEVPPFLVFACLRLRVCAESIDPGHPYEVPHVLKSPES